MSISPDVLQQLETPVEISPSVLRAEEEHQLEQSMLQKG
jgi:hypothetical protein